MNIVELSGVVSHIPVERELANGNRNLSWRLKVPREESGTDSIPCTVNFEQASASLLTRVANLDVGQVVTVTGNLRSRFWQGASGSSSRVEVEIVTLKKIAKKDLLRID